MKFQFKHEYWGDEWQDLDGIFRDHEHAAEELAEKHWSDDPSDPWNFEFDVVMRDEKGIEKIINVTAESQVIFYGSEVLS